VSVLLVRHAEAGDRDRWGRRDDLRPLDIHGEAQARALVDQLADFAVDRVLSSPYVRCSQTVAPLAAARGLAVEPADDLAEGAGPAAQALVHRLLTGPDHTVLCTHGDVVEDVLDALGVERDDVTDKGATWVLEPGGARCLAPPA
jgi:phosphohistidine phosphatase SixA